VSLQPETLLNPSVYPHSVPDPVELIETHISWVFLAGHFAYKIKKPIANNFLDYSTLEKRHAACVHELNLGKRLAPEMYIDVVPITIEDGVCRVDGDANPLDFAVRMRRFSSESLLSKRLDAGVVSEQEIEQLGRSIARFHNHAMIAARDRSGGIESISHRAMENIESLRRSPLLPDKSVLQEVERWTVSQCSALQERFLIREQLGWIRECHGDMHCSNVAYFRDHWTLFDGIEFNDELSCIDTMSDIAFLVMDLIERKKSGLAWLMLNTYLEESGDYHGLSILKWYLVYRAMVRAKVALMRAEQLEKSDPDQNRELASAIDYLNLAFEFTATRQRQLWITHGFSGSGKTHGSRWAVRELGMVRLRSDVERKRLFHLSHPNMGSHVDANDLRDLYSVSATEAVYRSLWSLSRELLDYGFSVLVDATFLKYPDRKRFSDLAKSLDIPFKILDFQNHVSVLEQRIRERKVSGTDASDADVEVLHRQLKNHDPLTESEQLFVQ
jgi:aminoglycoside phosphotransferase family enzyme/predicted kinase